MCGSVGQGLLTACMGDYHNDFNIQKNGYNLKAEYTQSMAGTCINRTDVVWILDIYIYYALEKCNSI